MHMQLQKLPMPSHWAAGPFHMHYSCQLIRVGPLHRELLLLPMPSCWPILYAITAAADGFALAHYICNFSNCRCLRAGSLRMNCSSFRWVRVGPLHRQPLLLPMPLCWPITYAIAADAYAFTLAHCVYTAATADGFELACCIGSSSSCRFLRVGQFHTQLQLLPMDSCRPIEYAAEVIPMPSQ